MASGYAQATGWTTTPDFDRRRFDFSNGTGTQQSLMASLTGAAPRSPAPGFGDQQSAMDRFFALKQQEALSSVAKRADQLAAARGMHIDGGQSVQMEQELANDAIGQLNYQQAGANADLMAQQRAYALQQQQLAEERRQFDAQMRAQEQQRQYEQQMKDKLYNDMRNASTGAGAQAGAARNPFATTLQQVGFQDGQSGTNFIGDSGPATSGSKFGQSNLLSSTGQSVFGQKKPDRVFTETKQQAEDRGANLSGGSNSAPYSLGQTVVGYAQANPIPRPGQLSGTTASFMTRR